jgi:hypothetical protein
MIKYSFTKATSLPSWLIATLRTFAASKSNTRVAFSSTAVMPPGLVPQAQLGLPGSPKKHTKKMRPNSYIFTLSAVGVMCALAVFFSLGRSPPQFLLAWGRSAAGPRTRFADPAAFRGCSHSRDSDPRSDSRAHVARHAALFVPFVSPLVANTTGAPLRPVCTKPVRDGLVRVEDNQPQTYSTLVDVGEGFVVMYALTIQSEALRVHVSRDFGASFVSPRIGPACTNEIADLSRVFVFTPMVDPRVVVSALQRSRLVSHIRRLYQSHDPAMPCYSRLTPAGTWVPAFSAAWALDRPWKAIISHGLVASGGTPLASEDGIFWNEVVGVRLETPCCGGSPVQKLGYNDAFWNLVWDAASERYRVSFRYNGKMGMRSQQQSASGKNVFSDWSPPSELHMPFRGAAGQWEDFYTTALDPIAVGRVGFVGWLSRMLKNGVVPKTQHELEMQVATGMDVVPVALDPSNNRVDYLCGSNETYFHKGIVPGSKSEPLKNRYAVFVSRGFVECGDTTFVYVQAGPLYTQSFRIHRFAIPRNELGGMSAREGALLRTREFQVPSNVSRSRVICRSTTTRGQVSVGFRQSGVLVPGMETSRSVVDANGGLCWKRGIDEVSCSVSRLGGTSVAVEVAFEHTACFGLEFY